MMEKQEPISQPYVSTATGTRQFACFPVAVVVFLVNEHEEVLLLAHPKRHGNWEPVNGAVEAGKTIMEGALRETHEEVGAHVMVRPLGTVHVSTFHDDTQVRYMLSVSYVMAYEGGEIEPGDDMAGSHYQWWRLEHLMEPRVALLVPRDEKWQIQRSIEVYRLWKGQDVALQPPRVVPERVKPK